VALATKAGTDLVERVAATGLIVPGEPLVVMVSGGRDSTCLLAIASELGADVTALHVNYGLRGKESDGDEVACHEQCARVSVELEVVRAEHTGAGNIQAWARDVRYTAAEALAQTSSARIAVAHTATDQLETILYRLATSPGRRALLGMETTRENIVRPLLAAGATRDETAAFCKARAFTWREDSSNSDHSFARVRVREELLPALLAVDARAHDNVLRTAELLRAEGEVLDEVVDSALRGRDEIGRDELAALPPALARLILRRLAEAATGRPGARTAARLNEVLSLDEGALDAGDGARVEVRDGTVRVTSTPDR
jgi:tRNA(Ile)-lysidine synthase